MNVPKKAKPKKKMVRDIEKGYSAGRFSEKLRRLAKCLESGRSFSITISGERVAVPANAKISIEHERTGAEEEIEFQLKWKRG